MGFWKHSKEQKALHKIKTLQSWLNKNFPDKLPMEPMLNYKFVEAEDFLVEEARRWDESKKR